MRIEQAIRIRDSLCSHVRESVDWAIRSRCSQRDYLDSRAKIYALNDYKRIPEWARCYVQGYERALMQCVVEHMHVHAYFVDGAWLVSGEYDVMQVAMGNQPSALVWSAEHSRVWFES